MQQPAQIPDFRQANAETGIEFEWAKFLYLFRKYRLIVYALLVLGILASFLFLRYSKPVYESSLVLQIQSKNTAQKVLKVEDIYDEQNDLAAAIELIKSKFLLKRALETLPLQIGYFNEGNLLDFELYRSNPFTVKAQLSDSSVMGRKFYIEFLSGSQFELKTENQSFGKHRIGEDIALPFGTIKILVNDYERIKGYINNAKNRPYFVFNNVEVLAKNYIKRLSVLLLNPNANTIKIAFQSSNPRKARDIVTALANEFTKYDIEERSKSSRNVLGFIDKQLDKYYNKLKVSENKLQQFQKQNKISGSSEFSAMYMDKLNRLENQVIDLDLQINVLKEIQTKAKEAKQEVEVFDLLSILAGTEYESTINGLITNLQRLLDKKQQLQNEVTPDSEVLRTLNLQIDAQRDLIIESLHSLLNKLENQRAEVARKIKEFEQKFYDIPAKELEYARLERMFSIDEKFFTLLLEKRTEYSISEAGFVPQHTILEQAEVPSVPIKPNKRLIFITFIVGSLVLGIGFIIVKYLFHNEITSVADITENGKAKIGILGVVPKYKKEIPVSQLIIDKNPKSVISEAFRTIRANLQFISNEPGAKVMAITSTVSGEGKTFVAINIAGIIAYSDKKVIILDLDMRKPKIHLGFGAENDKGMSTLLIEKENLSACIKHSSLKGLDFITAGPIPPNPSELIINGKLTEIIDELKQTYDLVIIDNPPIGLVTDALYTISIADYPIYVLRANYSKKDYINNAYRIYRENNIHKLSVVLNSVDFEQGQYGYGYYGYGYGYGYGYYEDVPEKKTFWKSIFTFNKK